MRPIPEVEDGPVGFHAQQAVEKALKVALALRGIDFPKTHDLDYLIALTDQSSFELAPELAFAGWLTPWAAEFRYDDAPLDMLDRKRAIEVADIAVTWCQDLIAEVGDVLSPKTPLAGRSQSGPDSSAG